MTYATDSDGHQAYPLDWPDNAPRTPVHRRQRARFDTSFAVARDALLDELRRLGGTTPVISTNISLRRDGLPYARQPQPDDPGVAVYWRYKGQPACMACDRWTRVEDNLQAIRKTIEALRGIERWAASDMVDRAFHGFQALPGPESTRNVSWREVLQLAPSDGLEAARQAYLALRKAHHPDHGGDPKQFRAVQSAWEQAQKEIGG